MTTPEPSDTGPGVGDPETSRRTDPTRGLRPVPSLADQVRHVSRLMGTSHRRDIGSWRLPVLVSVLFAMLFAVSGAALGPLRDRAELATFRVAVSGDTARAGQFLTDLSDYSLIARPSADPERDVEIQDATLGLVLGPDTDARISAGLTPDIDVYVRSSQHASVEAHTRYVLAVDDLLLGGAPGPDLNYLDSRDDVAVNRLEFSVRLAGVVALLAGGSIATAGSVLGGLRDNRGVDALLVLPIRRGAIVTGTAVGTMALATIRLLVASLTVLVLAALPVPTLGLPGEALAPPLTALPFVCLLLGLLIASTGQLAASMGGGADDSLALGDLLALPFLLMGVLVFLAPDLPLNAVSAAVPGLGPILILRDSVQGHTQPLAWLLATGSTLAATTGLLSIAARLIGSERWILRGTS